MAPFPMESRPLPPIPATVKRPREIDSVLNCSQSPTLSSQDGPMLRSFLGHRFKRTMETIID